MVQSKLVKFDMKGKGIIELSSMIEEIFKTVDLNDDKSIQFKECIERLKEESRKLNNNSNNWNKIKEKLTAKQLLYVLENQ